MIHPQHHMDIRKRVHLKHKPYPSNKTFIRWLDYWIAALGVVTSLSVVPQVLEIWINQSAESVSIITWSVFALWNYSMFLYGVAHRAKPIIITCGVGLPLYTSVVIGILVY